RPPCHLSYFCYCYVAHRDLHSFPTRRSSDLIQRAADHGEVLAEVKARRRGLGLRAGRRVLGVHARAAVAAGEVLNLGLEAEQRGDRKSTRLNSSHVKISYAVFCLKKKNKQ